MNQIIRHRGPDDEGFVLFNDSTISVLGSNDTAAETWLATGIHIPKGKLIDSDINTNIALGHRRLSILDLSPRGHQPLCDKDGRYWIIFNGEIYNYLEIKEELVNLGHSFLSDTDTEVIIEAYKRWGVECQHRFNGMWAFAIYDSVDTSIFLSRDRFGIKPLYYWFSPSGDFYFGSEIKQFTELPGWRAVLNGPRAFDYLSYALTDHTDETMFKGVNMLLPGHYYASKIQDVLQDCNNGKISLTKWYQPVIGDFSGSLDEAKDEFLKRFKNAIELHLRSDVPVGSALSGGLDSSSIVSYVNSLLRIQSKSELQKTFSSCAEDERYDERSWMEVVVAETQVDAHYVYPKGEDVFTLSQKLIWHMDEPYQSQSAFLANHVFGEARNNNVKVLLNGQGADEYLSGYSNFRILRQKKLMLSGKILALSNEIGLKGCFRVLTQIIYDALPENLRYRISNYTPQNRRKSKLINRKLLIDSFTHPYQINPHTKKSHKTISSYQLLKEPLQKYLRWEDRNSMAHSVEARVPFLDYKLVEFTQSLPLDYLDQPNQLKRILVESMKGILPELVRNRKDKIGFIAPEERWFKYDHAHEYVEWLKSLLPYSKGIINERYAVAYFKDVQQGKIKFDYTYWHILLFCLWMKVFKVELE